MSLLTIKPAKEAQFDLVSLGEVMLRFDPGDMRIRNTRSFNVWEGGGEYNVARGLRKCFQKRSAIVTVLTDNELGRLVEDLILQGGVDTTLIKWLPFDGIGRKNRNGIYFLERGFGERTPLAVSDRGMTGISALAPNDIDWDALFGDLGVRWFHTGGVFAGLSPQSHKVILEAMAAARRHGTIISYDLNYRASLWQEAGGKEAAVAVNKKILPQVDVLFGLEELEGKIQKPDFEPFEEAIRKTLDTFPNIKAVASTIRVVSSAAHNDWSGVCGTKDDDFFRGPVKQQLAIYDRVGGGDSFASGFIYGIMEKEDPQAAIEYAVAHGALAMTTPGDNSMVSLAQVEETLQDSKVSVHR